MTYEEYKSRVIAAQEQWNVERSKIYAHYADGNYATIFDGDFQPPHITTPDNYDNMSLDQMQAAVAAMKPRLVDDAVTAWANIGMNLMGTFLKFNQEFSRTVTGGNGHGGWTGAAASAAVAAVNNYSQRSIPLSQAATAISWKLTEMRTGIEQTQALMPGLTERENVTGKTLPAEGVMKVDDHNREEATQEARRILRTVYSQVAGQADVGVPFLPTAPVIAGDSGSPGGPADAGSNSGDTPGDSASDGSPENLSADDDPAASESPESEPSSTTTQSTDPSSTTTHSPTSSPQTSTPSTSAPPTGSPSTTGPGVTAPGGSGSNGARGGADSASRGGAASGGSASPGKSSPGSPSPAAAAGTGPRSGAAGSGGRGGAGMGAMGAPGARGGSEEERTNGVPDYLITQDNGDLLIGTDGIKTVPPVIGGDHDSAPS
ncbi:hypothetical protein [Nocardia caishijiensis]|uniref:PPE family protein n=1 Tax=Nocardia caishijiensis TaxID=184756 RepID=A0ABQ6YJ10_9NOCA|nr:hypothetical protein [Nocardia caishijiensis]KAF0845774.1 hypothetical protein FNL39_106163 [Nocardia caishijiensis]